MNTQANNLPASDGPMEQNMLFAVPAAEPGSGQPPRAQGRARVQRAERRQVIMRAQALDELRNELSKQGVFTTTLEELYNWGRKNSV